jgi:serpin B
LKLASRNFDSLIDWIFTLIFRTMKTANCSLNIFSLLRFVGCICCGAASAVGMAQAQPTWVSRADNAFAVNLYTKLAAESPDNLFFSPNSIQTALTMTYAGARGETAAQMAAVLHLPPGTNTIEKDFGAYLKELNSTTTGGGKAREYELSEGNALRGQKGYGFLPGFVNLLNTDYGAGLVEVDFKNNSKGARQRINTWVARETNDKIKDLIGRGVLTNDTRLVLTNAIYFKGT